MALGQRIITWGADDQMRGMSTTPEVADGGFSNQTSQVNINSYSGVIRAVQAQVDKSTNVTGNLIASCEDPTGTYARLFVSADSSDDGQLYSADGTGSLTTRGSEDTTRNYITGRTDMIAFKNEAYITNATTIVRWSGIGGANTIDPTFKGFADGNAPHPAVVFEDNAYYGDGDELLRQTAAGTPPTVILTLPTGWIITALGIDPGSGKMLIGIVDQYNISGNTNAMARIGFYDGFSNKLQRVVIMDDMVTAFPATSGDLYVAYGQSLGYWNGSGATFLRKMNISLTNTELMYKHHFTSVGATLYICEKTKLIAHGPVQIGGSKVFYPAFDNVDSVTNLTMAVYLGVGTTTVDQIIAFGATTNKWYTMNIYNVSTGGYMDLYSNEYPLLDMNDGAWITKARVFWKSTVAAGVTPAKLYFYNENGIVDTIGNGGELALTNTSGVASAMKEVVIGGATGARMNQLQFRLVADTAFPGVTRIDIFGYPANK